MGFKVMQIEVSNFCSLDCWYCPHPTQKRTKGDMTMETFRKCLELVHRSDNPLRNGKKWVWFNHFGEPLLNPLLLEFLEEAKNQDIEISLASNGVDYDGEFFPRETWQRLADAGLTKVMLSAHVKTEKALRNHVAGIVNVLDVWKPRSEFMHDWAGQVDISRKKRAPKPQPPTKPCDYQTHDMFAVTWDGRIAACCYDSEGLVELTVDDILANGFEFRPVSLCSECTLGRGDVEWL